MKYIQKRRLYSQNFLYNPKLVAKLIRLSSLGKNDTVLEIGPGKGAITQQLLDVAGKVIAVERDYDLFKYLQNKFSLTNNLALYRENFLDYQLPQIPFKVFSNIPFIITADVIRKLTSSDLMIEAYLIIQKEAAKKFIGMPYDIKNSMIANLLKPWFEISVFWNLKRYDFIPKPKVDCVMIKIKRLENSLIPDNLKRMYRDFIIYSYSRNKIAKSSYGKILKLFNEYVRKVSPQYKRIISKEAQNICRQQKMIQKIHRTRNDKNWKRF